MTSPRSARSTLMQFVPIAVWAVSAAVVAITMPGVFEFESHERAIAHYDAGTRAAQSGDHGQAVLELLRAQRLVAGFWPDADRLSTRIDANLSEVRARVKSLVESGGTPETEPDSPPVAARSHLLESSPRSGSDRLLAAVRSVPWPLRVLVAAGMLGLALALGASRLFAARAGTLAARGTRPDAFVPRGAVWIVFAGALICGLLALADVWADARRVEAVVIRGTLLREGPDDLTYPPALLTPLPPGAEVEVRDRSSDGLWIRVRLASIASSAETSGWLPASAVELVSVSRASPAIDSAN